MSRQGKKLSCILGVDLAVGRDKGMLVMMDEHGNLTFMESAPAGTVFIYDESPVGGATHPSGAHGHGA
jgi:hypothetical protein